VRTLLILVFAVAAVWLFTERLRLTDQVTSLEEQLKKKQEEVDDYAKQAQATSARPSSPFSNNGQPGTAKQPIVPQKPGWINEHVEKGARALDPKR
jgi:hypothetical protein